MSSWETVPDVADEENPEGWADYLADVYADVRDDRRARIFHDRDGFYALMAGSPECLALGHTFDEARSLATGEGEYLPTELHPPSWGTGIICVATRYGVACTRCEGECELDDVPMLWALPGVLAVAS